MLNNEEFLDLYIKEVTEAAYDEESLQDYFECMNDYSDGTMSI